MIGKKYKSVFLAGVISLVSGSSFAQTWTPDNGNGTFTNPLFYDEFSDPDIIRVGTDFYLTGTTMHCFPGLPVMHSKDLVNWTLLGYAFDKLNMGAEFKLEDNKEAYGQGIWAPCGYAEFDDFKVNEPFADRATNIPTGKIITLTNLTTNNQAWANPHGMLHTARQGSKELNGPGCQFRVHDRGNGRVVLEALNSTGFITITGAGLTADVRLVKQESEASLLQWQDLLHDQCMLLSPKTNRYIGLNPVTATPYSADYPGTRPDRKDGVVFKWTIVKD